MEKDKSYNNIVEYYKTKQDNKKEIIAVEPSAKGVSYNENWQRDFYISMLRAQKYSENEINEILRWS